MVYRYIRNLSVVDRTKLCSCGKKSHTHPMEGHRKLEGGDLKNYEAKLEFLGGGGGGGTKQTTFHGRRMDIF